MDRSSMLSAAAIAALLTTPAQAAQIILTPSAVYGSSGSYSATYLADNILDQQTGDISEPAQDGSYWLNPDSGAADAFISIDLGAAYRVTGFEFFNTHNAAFNDRGTGAFYVLASNDAGFASSVTLVSGTLAAQTAANDPLDAQAFAVSNTGAFRYVQFHATSAAAGGSPCCGPTPYGLNELRVFGQAPGTVVPEPAVWALMMLGFGGLGAVLRSRRRAVLA